jgi:FkbM family methyltransferase
VDAPPLEGYSYEVMAMTTSYRYHDICIRKPFEPAQLPLLVRAYQKSFKSGLADNPAPLSKVLNRILFYTLFTLPFPRWEGTFRLADREDTNTIVFNARNRQFNSLYFHKYQRVYESETSTLLDLFLPEDGVLFDIGSNWGYFSLFAAVRKTFCGNVHSFEPWPPTFADLQSIVDQSGYADVITCHNLALSSKSGECGMKVHSHSGLNELDTRGECPVVKIAALDDLSLPAPSFMKVDVEGHEIDMFTGAKETIAASKPFVIFEHTLRFPIQEAMDTVFSILQAYGYCFFIPAWEVGDKEPPIILTEEIASTQQNQFNRFVLLPLQPATRALYPERLNIFACHRDRLSALHHPNMGTVVI